MKNKLILSLLAVAFLACSCETEEWPTSDIKLVPIYAISSIVGSSAPYSLEIYRENPLLIEYTTSLRLNAQTTSNYIDDSDETNYNVSFNASKDTVTSLGIDTLLNRRYVIAGNKSTNIGTMTVFKYNKLDTVATNYTMKVINDTRYN